VQAKHILPILGLFLAFFVLSNPETAGPQTRSFITWIGDQASAAGTFLDGVFDESNDPVDPATDGTTGTQDGFDTMAPLAPVLS